MINFEDCICGEGMVFLRRKGNNTGLYCHGCGKWKQWVGKKDLNMLKSRGYVVFNEGYEPDLIKVPKPKDVGSIPVGEVKYDDNYTSPNFGTVENTVVQRVENRVENRVASGDCITCNSGELIKISSNANSTVFGNVLTIYGDDNKTLIGVYKLLYCPTCGKEL